MTIPTCPHARRDKTRLTAQLQTLPHITANASNPMLGKFIRALLRPISRFALNTGSGAPYCYAIRDAGSSYVLTALRAYAYAIALSRALRSIRALCHPGVALRLPRAVFWRPFRALHSSLAIFVTSAVGRCPFPLAIFVTSAVGRCPFPLAIYGEGVADRLGVRSKHIFPIAIFVTSATGRCPFLPRHICHICRRQMSIPHRHLWRGGGRQAGGEVKQLNKIAHNEPIVTQPFAILHM